MRGPDLEVLADGRLWRWLVPAVIVHVVGLGLAGKVDAHRDHASLEAPATIDVATEISAATAKPPEPTPPGPPRVDDAPGASPRPVTGPPVPKPRAPKPAPTTPDTRNQLEDRFVHALSAVAAEAAKILTSTEGNGPPIASGNAVSSYGMVAGDGTGSSPTFDARAGLGGRGGGKGPPAASEGPDRSRGPQVFMGYNEDCEFPAQANSDSVDHGWAMLIVTVLPNGHASAVQLLSDSGHGFGPMARQCAMHAKYRPALDRNGVPIQADTPQFRYRFTR